MITCVADTHAIEAGSSAVTVVQAGEHRAVLPTVACTAEAFPINTEAVALAVVGTCALTAVLPGVALITVAGSIHTAPVVIAVFGTDQLRAVSTGPRIVTHTVPITALAAALTVVQALCLGAVFPQETIRADADTANTSAMSSTVHRADLQRAVLSREAFEALTLSVHTEASVQAVTGTLRLGAVGSLPSWRTYTATGVSTVVSMAVAVRLDCNITFH